eukprot:CAMPEP_0201576912 /NCGR_PEP_ID=MMETSP0190_2-20130828/22989_1 /ASSEMBLY_ACC=CAM_ASM_000263 /TAXON_ID=37353 /ORGANISM="Rosalina sp." /LENGTH=341 /DNA_ID=CAMNT_0048008325 /DNA_START=194 /DNA_END=1216 /DNA_ORIENTATION=-
MQTNFITDDSLKLTPLIDTSYELSSDDTLDNNNMNSTHLIHDSSLPSPQFISPPIAQTQLKHSMSDDEVCYDKKEDLMPALKLKDTLSASAVSSTLKRKRKKGRSNSAIISSKNTDKYHDKWKTLKKQYKMQTDKLQVYQDTITDIQDEREELESRLKKEFELKILHLETKYHLEKGEKDTLRHENEKLRQQLFVRNQELQRMQSITSGYSTGSINGGGSINGQIPLIQRISTQSSHKSKSHQSSPIESCSSNTTTNSSESDNSSSSGTDSTITTISDDDDDDDDHKTYKGKDEGDNYTTNVINTVSKRGKKRTSKNKKVSKQLNRKIQEKQPKGFWSTVW